MCRVGPITLSHISMSSLNLILFFLRLLNRCPVSFRYWIITFLTAIVPKGSMDNEINRFGQHLKPIRTIVLLLVSFGWGVVGFLTILGNLNFYVLCEVLSPIQPLYTRYPIVARRAWPAGCLAFRPSASREQRYLADKYNPCFILYKRVRPKKFKSMFFEQLDQSPTVLHSLHLFTICELARYPDTKNIFELKIICQNL